MKKLAQFLAVVFAVSMIAGYVLHAQRQQTRRAETAPPPVVAFSSKSAAPAIRAEVPVWITTPTNEVLSSPKAGPSAPRGIASGSKSRVPLVTYPANGPELLKPLPPPAILPGSKGAPIFPTVPVQSGAGAAKPEIKVSWTQAAPATPTTNATAPRIQRKGQ